MEHSPGFLKLVKDAKTRVREITIKQARERLKQNPKAILLDVREDHEWQKSAPAEILSCSMSPCVHRAIRSLQAKIFHESASCRAAKNRGCASITARRNTSHKPATTAHLRRCKSRLSLGRTTQEIVVVWSCGLTCQS